MSDVEAEVAKYNAKVQRSTKVISQKSLTSLCKDFIQRIDVATKNNGKPLKPKEKLLIQQIVKSIEMLGEEDEEII
ncbi:MAG: hypothetical protein LKG21_04045 [Ruminococcus sp.]|nr:hypothetical protein [Ruminococcus sp.]